MPTEIPLGRSGQVALVDDADASLVAGYTWFRHDNGHGGVYARGYRRPVSRPLRWVYMHALIAGYPRPDHENRDGLDNRRQNLRPASESEQHANMQKKTSSPWPYKGIYHAPWGPWLARICVNYRNRHLGSFPTAEAAARAYDAAALEAWGAYARLNFPQ